MASGLAVYGLTVGVGLVRLTRSSSPPTASSPEVLKPPARVQLQRPAARTRQRQ